MLFCKRECCTRENHQGFRIISDTKSGIPLDTIISDLIGERIDNDARTYNVIREKYRSILVSKKSIRLKYDDRIVILRRFYFIKYIFYIVTFTEITRGIVN